MGIIGNIVLYAFLCLPLQVFAPREGTGLSIPLPYVDNPECEVQAPRPYMKPLSPSCRTSDQGLTKCCNCIYGPHYQLLNATMYQMWENYKNLLAHGRWPEHHHKPPEPIFIDAVSLKYPLVAIKEPSGPASISMKFACHSILPDAIARTLYLVSRMMLPGGVRRRWIRKYQRDGLVPTLTKQYVAQCIRGQERIQNMLVPSMQAALVGQTGGPDVLVPSSRCVSKHDTTVVPTPYDVPSERIQYNQNDNVGFVLPAASNSKILVGRKRTLVELQQGSCHCIGFEVPQIRDPETTAAAVASTSDPTLLAVIEQATLTKEVPDLNIALFDPMLPLELQPVSESQPALVVDDVFLVAKNYENIHPGRYHPREIDSIGGATIYDFGLPRGPEVSDRHQISRAFDLDLPMGHDQRIGSVEVCATLGLESSAANMLLQLQYGEWN